MIQVKSCKVTTEYMVWTVCTDLDIAAIGPCANLLRLRDIMQCSVLFLTVLSFLHLAAGQANSEVNSFIIVL